MRPCDRCARARCRSTAGCSLLLLPAVLERLPEREAVEAVLRAPDAVAVEPPRVSYGALARLPSGGAR